MGELSQISLLSAATLILASSIPFYFAWKMRAARTILILLSLTLGLTLFLHGMHHALEFTELELPGLVVGLASALLAILFAALYYLSWRLMRAEP